MCIPRKHSDVIKAIADGKPVQYQTWQSGLFNDWNDSCRMNPISDPLLEWRIKPEPKPDRVFESEVKQRAGGCPYIYAIWENTNQPKPHSCTWPTNLRLVFDGETMELKDAEVIK